MRDDIKILRMYKGERFPIEFDFSERVAENIGSVSATAFDMRDNIDVTTDMIISTDISGALVTVLVTTEPSGIKNNRHFELSVRITTDSDNVYIEKIMISLS